MADSTPLLLIIRYLAKVLAGHPPTLRLYARPGPIEHLTCPIHRHLAEWMPQYALGKASSRNLLKVS
jgi:hypothetical protein